MANTFRKIQTVTVGSGGATDITFSSIPQTYTDLKIVLSGRSTQGNIYGGGRLEFNSDTASNYKWRRILGSGSSASFDSSTSATSITNWEVVGASSTASVFSIQEFYIPNYTSSNQKSVSINSIGENNSTEAYMGFISGLWTSTAAITSIKLYSASNNFVQYTTATLYGVSNVPVLEGAKATGGTITADNNYIYHTFLSSGTFTPTQSITADYLVVAGAGGGATLGGGGGGAGGLRCTVGATGGGGSLESALSLTATAYTVTVGAGGAGGASGGNNPGTSGSNSVFSSITSTGGGGGGAGGSGGTSGGSGGGTGRNSTGAPGTGTTNQGFAGGSNSSEFATAGGGGGAGVAGGNATTSIAGNGGNGITTSISGTSTTYGGGGGGGVLDNRTAGSGGTGGGGAAGVGNSSSSGTAGTRNTGGGGGASSVLSGQTTGSGAAGGSGIVIVRYAR